MVRAVVVLAAVIIAIVTWQPGMGPNFQRYIFSTPGFSSGSGSCSALPGPAVLSYLTWETAKIQSTQSATGILYVDFFTVIVGEVLARYLLLSTTIPSDERRREVPEVRRRPAGGSAARRRIPSSAAAAGTSCR